MVTNLHVSLQNYYFFSIDFHIALSDLQVARPLCSAVQGRQSMSAIGGEVLGATPRKPPIGRNRGRPRGVRFHTPALAPHWARYRDARYDFQLCPSDPRPPFPIGYD